jgi:hypothetical protein
VPESYFNYFTEIETHFQKARGTSLFLMSPLDWALIESWKNSGIPLEAVLRGIDAAFEKWQQRKNKFQQVNSLAYCAQAVAKEAAAVANGVAAKPKKEVSAPFTLDELRGYIENNARKLRARQFDEIAAALEALLPSLEEHYSNLEDLEQRLSVLEEKLIATVRSRSTDEQLLAARRDLDAQLRPYRGKLATEQLAMIERQFFERRLIEDAQVPRVSLFYLGAQE